jgi:hypothetical protein
MEDTSEEIHSVTFNQDNGCFIVATSTGLRVFNTNEFQSTFFRGKLSVSLNQCGNLSMGTTYTLCSEWLYSLLFST